MELLVFSSERDRSVRVSLYVCLYCRLPFGHAEEQWSGQVLLPTAHLWFSLYQVICWPFTFRRRRWCLVKLLLSGVWPSSEHPLPRVLPIHNGRVCSHTPGCVCPPLELCIYTYKDTAGSSRRQSSATLKLTLPSPCFQYCL